MKSRVTAHLDTFARDRLPPPDQWAELSFERPELRYPDRLNAAAELLDGGEPGDPSSVRPPGRSGRTANCGPGSTGSRTR